MKKRGSYWPILFPTVALGVWAYSVLSGKQGWQATVAQQVLLGTGFNLSGREILREAPTKVNIEEQQTTRRSGQITVGVGVLFYVLGIATFAEGATPCSIGSQICTIDIDEKPQAANGFGEMKAIRRSPENERHVPTRAILQLGPLVEHGFLGRHEP